MKHGYMPTLFAVMLMCIFFPEKAVAQTDGLVKIRNTSSDPKKICMYRSYKAGSAIVLLPYKCFKLLSGEMVTWNREGDRSSFVAKIFKPALIDKYLYTRNLPGDTITISIGGAGRLSHTTYKPMQPVTKYRLQVCNQQYDDIVYFTLGYETNSAFFSEGWWNLKKGECMEVGVSERLKKVLGVEFGNTPRTFYYAQTYGKTPQEWNGGADGRSVCVNNKKEFRTLYLRGNDGNYPPSPCGGDGQKQVSFRLLGEPTANQEYYYLTF